MPDIHPHKNLYKAALYLDVFRESLVIGRKNITRLTGGQSKLERRNYS